MFPGQWFHLGNDPLLVRRRRPFRRPFSPRADLPTNECNYVVRCLAVSTDGPQDQHGGQKWRCVGLVNIRCSFPRRASVSSLDASRGNTIGTRVKCRHLNHQTRVLLAARFIKAAPMSLVVFVALAVFAQVAYLYTKARSEFGKHCNFKDEPAKLLATVPVTDAYADQYTKRNPSIAEVDTTPHM